jgi:hypothetical protein
MNRAFITTLLALTLISSAVARLGETEKEIEARFGEAKPSGLQRQPGAQTFKYLKNGFEIQVVFHQGKSIWEIFHKKDGSGAFPEADIKNLLDGYKEPKESNDPKQPKEPKRTWRFDRRENRWESAGKPKYIAYLMPEHKDFFCIKDLASCEALDKAAAGSKGL